MDLRTRQRRAVEALLDLLGPRESQLAVMPIDAAEREAWTYLPGDRHGVPLSMLDRAGSVAVMRLLATGLSTEAFTQAAAIMALEDVLEEVERADRDRHRGDYWVAVFGRPGDDAWGWRIEGHHVSVNATWAADDEPRITPLFLGSNPATVTKGERVVHRPLGPEEEIGFELVRALDREAFGRALLAEEAPDDIMTSDRARVTEQPEPHGVAIDKLSGRARQLADELVGLYLDRLPDGAARPSTDGLSFGWAGGTEPGDPHYYRVQGNSLVIELDNTQNGANHVHTVVRDLDGDFGRDVLGDHLRSEHR